LLICLFHFCIFICASLFKAFRNSTAIILIALMGKVPVNSAVSL
jgi:hypothetical protein